RLAFRVTLFRPRAFATRGNEGLVLADQAREFRERIVLGRGERTIRTVPRIRVGTLRTITRVVGHLLPPASASRSVYGWNSTTLPDAFEQDHRISSGALTPSKSSPEARIMTTPWTRARRARVSCGSSWIMKRKYGKSLPRVHCAR